MHALSAIAVVVLTFLLSIQMAAQQTDQAAPVIVQPGAPGQITKVLPSTSRAVLPPSSAKDVEFMQGMIMHHAQAVEMVDLIASRTENKEIRLLGSRIGHTQADEINLMKRWLISKGESTEMPMPTVSGSHSHGGHSSANQMVMPGMLSEQQMNALRKAKGSEFDELFLSGMIQHHGGALIMVKELLDTAGAGQDAELFNFVTDVDSGQRAEIRIMQNLLSKKKVEEIR